METRNILIIGGNGFLGKNLVNKLSQSFNVVVVDAHTENCQCKSYQTTLSNTGDIKNIIEKEKIEIVMNLASRIGPSSSEEDYLNDKKDTFLSCDEILGHLNKKGIKYIFFSSGGAVYGNDKDICHEDSRLNPVSYYGISKKELEELTLKHHAEGLDYLIIRPSNPYGHGQNIRGKQGLIANLIGRIIDNKPIEIWGNGENEKDYIYIDDFVYYIDKLIKEGRWNQTYNVGSGETTSINRIVDIVKGLSSELPEIVYTPFHSNDVRNVRLDCEKVKSVSNHSCKSIQEGIELFLKEEMQKIKK